jgi:hypothetical protein
VTRLALAALAARDPASLSRLGLVVTMGTPHQGADLAGVVADLTGVPLTDLALEGVQAAVRTDIEPGATSVRQLAPGSALLRQLAREGVPRGVKLLSIGARADPVVPTTRTRVRDATNTTVAVPGLYDHELLPGAPETGREIALALAGLPPACESVLDALADTVVGHAVGSSERLVALLARASATATHGPSP